MALAPIARTRRNTGCVAQLNVGVAVTPDEELRRRSHHAESVKDQGHDHVRQACDYTDEHVLNDALTQAGAYTVHEAPLLSVSFRARRLPKLLSYD